MEGIETAVTAIVSRLDPSVNPYPSYEAIASSMFYPTTWSNFGLSCYICIGLFSA